MKDKMAKFTVVYDNNKYNAALCTGWGFSCWVQLGETTVLFDTGGEASTLLGNMAKLDLDPQAIDAVVLSHVHGDHTGGLGGLLAKATRPTVYMPAAFPASFKADVQARVEVVEVRASLEVAPKVHTTGQVGAGIVEQALIVETEAGSVIVTGCAHPGIVAMVRRAKEAVPGEIALVLGGFHLGSAGRTKVKGIIAEFRQLGVQKVAPSHCTGDRARRIFANAYHNDCLLPGVGWTTTLGTSA